MYLTDGYQGVAHITAAEVGDFNAGVIGGDCVLDVGEVFRAEIISNNKIRIYDGAAVIQGRRCGIPPKDFEEVVIDSGTQGQNRIDIIAIEYEKGSDNREFTGLAVIKGTPGTYATPPAVNKGSIRNGDLKCYMPLYHVLLNGINISAVTPLFTVQNSISSLLRPKPIMNPTSISQGKTITVENVRNLLILEFCNSSEYGRKQEIFIPSYNVTRYVDISSRNSDSLHMILVVTWSGTEARIYCSNFLTEGGWSSGTSQMIRAFTI